MAKTVIETPRAIEDGVEIEFTLRKGAGATIVQRLFVRTRVMVERDDSVEGLFSESFVHLDDTISTFSAGDSAALRALLLKLYNAEVARAGLD
jgi:hypothetical protein